VIRALVSAMTSETDISEAIPILLKLCGDGQDDVASAGVLLNAVILYPSRYSPVLATNLESSDEVVRIAAAWVLQMDSTIPETVQARVKGTLAKGSTEVTGSVSAAFMSASRID
jgi:hypothetical protein